MKTTDFGDKLKIFNKKITSKKQQNLYLLKLNLKKLQTIDLSIFIHHSNIFNDGAQLYLIFQTLYYTFKRLGDIEEVISWKSKDLLNEKLNTLTTNDNSLSPSINWYGDSNYCLLFKGSYLKQKNAPYTSPNRIDFFIVYQLDTWSWDLNCDFALKDCLFGSAELAKNPDPDKCAITSYDIGFDSRSECSLPNGVGGKNAISYGVDMSSSVQKKIF